MSARDPPDLSRRTALKTAAGTAASALTLSGPTAAQQQQPDFGGYLEDAKGGTFEDARGQDEVTVTVGGGDSQLAFLPTKLWIDPGTTVVFEWTSGGHNVLPEEIPDGSSWAGHEGLEDSGFTYEFTFETPGIYTYFCRPHKQIGMLGGIAVGDDVPTTSPGGGGGTTRPDFGGYLEDAKGGTFEDARGNDEVTVTVGGGSSQLAFLPTKLWIDPGTTVVFEWASGGHNVLPESIPSGSSWAGHEGLEDSGFTYEFTFETPGIYTYFCRPHKQIGMLGGIAVGDDVPTKTVGGGGTGRDDGGGGFVLPGGTMGTTLFAIGIGGVALGAAAILLADARSAVRRTPERVRGASEEVVDELDHDEFDPYGTASLIFVYFLILVGMWIFTYFVEFLGGGPVVTG